MANNATNVSVGKPKVAGSIYMAPLGTTLPTDSTTALGAAFTALGYVSEDGLTNRTEIDGSEVLRAWGGDAVNTVDGTKTDIFEFALIEALNADVLKAYYGSGNVTETSGAITVAVDGSLPAHAVYVVDMLLKGNRAKRIVIPDGAVTELGDIVYQDDALIEYPITLTAMADTSGKTHYEYIAAA